MPETSKAKERRVRPFELKALDETGQFNGLAAVYNAADDYGDIIMPGAFSRTLQHKGSKFPMLWHHFPHEPIGVAVVEDSPLGLGVTGKLELEVARARETHALMKQAKAEGLPFGLSFGFDTIQAAWQGVNRIVKEMKLWEISPTFFPAQRLATVADVKTSARSEGKPVGPFTDFADCVANSQDKDDPEAFCAFLEHQTAGTWPDDPDLRMRGIAHGITEAVKALRDAAAQEQHEQINAAVDQFDRGMSTLRAILEGDSDTSPSDPAALASLWALLHEMRVDARSRARA